MSIWTATTPQLTLRFRALVTRLQLAPLRSNLLLPQKSLLIQIRRKSKPNKRSLSKSPPADSVLPRALFWKRTRKTNCLRKQEGVFKEPQPVTLRQRRNLKILILLAKNFLSSKWETLKEKDSQKTKTSVEAAVSWEVSEKTKSWMKFKHLRLSHCLLNKVRLELTFKMASRYFWHHHLHRKKMLRAAK